VVKNSDSPKNRTRNLGGLPWMSSGICLVVIERSHISPLGEVVNGERKMGLSIPTLFVHLTWRIAMTEDSSLALIHLGRMSDGISAVSTRAFSCHIAPQGSA